MGGGEDGRRDEGRAWPDLAQQATNRRPRDKTDPKGRADEAEVARTILGLCDVDDRRLRRGIAAAEDARQRAGDEQPGQCFHDGQQRIINRQPAQREQQRRRPKRSDRLPSSGEAMKVAVAITSPIHAPTSIACGRSSSPTSMTSCGSTGMRSRASPLIRGTNHSEKWP